MSFSGHFWTLGTNLRHRLAPWSAPPGEPWSTTLDDPRVGEVRLSGELHRTGSPALVVAVHGLGGTIASHYAVRTAAAATQVGLDCLRFHLRGADRSGEDFYHAGLTADLTAALRSPALAHYRDIHVVGYSLGGHMTLCWAVAPDDPRVRSVASVCSPLDLSGGCAAIDQPSRAVYRGHVLRGLKKMYAAILARGRAVPTPWPTIRDLTTIRAWDRHAVVPRHGFVSVDDYHRRTSVGPRLAAVPLPALVVSAPDDPMIPPSTIAPFLRDLPAHVVHRWIVGGGHVAFSRRVDLGLAHDDLPQAPGLWGQVIHWLRGHR